MGEPVDHGSRRHYPPLEFCQVLTEARRRARLSTRALAARAGTNFSYVAKLERGERSPSVPMARALVAALRLTGDQAAVIEAAAIPGVGRGAGPYRPRRRPGLGR